MDAAVELLSTNVTGSLVNLTREVQEIQVRDEEIREVTTLLFDDMIKVSTDGLRRNKQVIKFTNELEELKKTNATKKEIADKAAELNDFVANTKAKNAAAISNAHLGIQAVSVLTGLCGNSELARQISVTGNATVTIITTIIELSKIDFAELFEQGLSIALNGMLNPITGILGAISMIASLLFNSGPTIEELILKQVQDLSKQVAELRKEMHKRFDQISDQLKAQHGTSTYHFDITQLRFDRIEAILGSVRQRLLTEFCNVHKSHQALSRYLVGNRTRIERLHQKIDDGFQSLYNQSYEEMKHNTIHYHDNFPYPEYRLKSSKVNMYFMRFLQFAHTGSKNNVLAGNRNRVLSLNALVLDIEANGLESHINELATFCSTHLKLADQPTLANPIVWQDAIKTFITFVCRVPELTIDLSDDRMVQGQYQSLLGIAAPGVELANFFLELRTKAVIEGLVERYQETMVQSTVRLMILSKYALQSMLLDEWTKIRSTISTQLQKIGKLEIGSSSPHRDLTDNLKVLKDIHNDLHDFLSENIFNKLGSKDDNSLYDYLYCETDIVERLIPGHSTKPARKVRRKEVTKGGKLQHTDASGGMLETLEAISELYLAVRTKSDECENPQKFTITDEEQYRNLNILANKILTQLTSLSDPKDIKEVLAGIPKETLQTVMTTLKQYTYYLEYDLDLQLTELNRQATTCDNKLNEMKSLLQPNGKTHEWDEIHAEGNIGALILNSRRYFIGMISNDNQEEAIKLTNLLIADVSTCTEKLSNLLTFIQQCQQARTSLLSSMSAISDELYSVLEAYSDFSDYSQTLIKEYLDKNDSEALSRIEIEGLTGVRGHLQEQVRSDLQPGRELEGNLTDVSDQYKLLNAILKWAFSYEYENDPMLLLQLQKLKASLDFIDQYPDICNDFQGTTPYNSLVSQITNHRVALMELREYLVAASDNHYLNAILYDTLTELSQFGSIFYRRDLPARTKALLVTPCQPSPSPRTITSSQSPAAPRIRLFSPTQTRQETMQTSPNPTEEQNSDHSESNSPR